MKKNPVPLFIFLIAISLIMFLLDRTGALSAVRAGLDGLFSPASKTLHSLSTVALDEKRADIAEKLANLDKIKKENDDLRAQLGVPSRTADKLLPAHVLSTGVFFIIDKGREDGVKEQSTVIYKNIFVGKIVAVTARASRVILPSEKGSIAGVKTVQTGALGNVYGQNRETNDILLPEVTLPEMLQEGDIVQTVGNVDESGVGIRPGYLIGTIAQVRKSRDQLFQEAKIVPLIDYRNLQTVFVVQ